MKKTKIAFVVYYLGYGGAEMALYYLVKLMDRERFDITVFTVHAGGEMEKEFRRYLKIQGISSSFPTTLTAPATTRDFPRAERRSSIFTRTAPTVPAIAAIINI